MAIDRRLLITGATITGLGLAGGIVGFRAGVFGDRSDRDSQAFAEAVADDYRTGRLVVVAGWILSATEVAAYQELMESETKPATTSSAPDTT